MKTVHLHRLDSLDLLFMVLFYRWQVASHTRLQVFRDKILSMADVGAGGEEAVVTFEGIAILTPRWVLGMIVQWLVWLRYNMPKWMFSTGWVKRLLSKFIRTIIMSNVVTKVNSSVNNWSIQIKCIRMLYWSTLWATLNLFSLIPVYLFSCVYPFDLIKIKYNPKRAFRSKLVEIIFSDCYHFWWFKNWTSWNASLLLQGSIQRWTSSILFEVARASQWFQNSVQQCSSCVCTTQGLSSDFFSSE